MTAYVIASVCHAERRCRSRVAKGSLAKVSGVGQTLARRTAQNVGAKA